MKVWGTGLLKGMAITMKNMVRGPITVQYPHEKIELPERARWAVKPKYDEEGNPKCTACMSCVRACPDFILDLQTTAGEDRSKHIDHFRYELGACMMCGLCVEACPFDAIEMSHDYELARCSAPELAYDLLTDVAAAATKRDKPAAGAAPKPQPEATPAQGGAVDE
jgi:NADH-quinone oxidoreductase subunit I